MLEPILIECEQGSPEWHQARGVRLTASRMNDVIKMSQRYANEIRDALNGIFPDYFYAPPLRHGRLNEPRAAAAYELRTNQDTFKAGFYVHPEFDFIGCSPDPLVGDDGATEIKCPYNSGNHIQTLAMGEVPEKHIPQIQSILWITGRKWLDFISFDPRQAAPRDLFIKRVLPDIDYHEMLKTRCHTFWFDMVINNKSMTYDSNREIPDLF